jgi:hypothetical protein
MFGSLGVTEKHPSPEINQRVALQGVLKLRAREFARDSFESIDATRPQEISARKPTAQVERAG